MGLLAGIGDFGLDALVQAALDAEETIQVLHDDTLEIKRLASSSYEEKGDWNALTNTPTLYSDATIGQTGVKYQRYVITVSGPLPFAIKDRIQGSTIPTGYLVQHPSGQWFYDTTETPALSKVNDISASIGTTNVNQSIGYSNLTGGGYTSNPARCYIQSQSFTMAGRLKTLVIEALTGFGGGFYLVLFRPNSTTLLEVSRTLLTATAGVNTIDLLNLGIDVQVGDTVGINVVDTMRFKNQSVTGAHYIFASINSSSKWEVALGNFPALPTTPNNIALAFLVTIQKTILKNVDAALQALQTTTTNNSTALSTLSGDVNSLKTAVLHTDPTYVPAQNILNQNSILWSDNTYFEWAFGFLPTEYTKLVRLEMHLNQVNANSKLTLKIYKRPVTNASSTIYPGSLTGDTLISSTDYLTSLFVGTSEFQDVSMPFTSILATPDFIYLFVISTTKIGGGVGFLGSDRFENSGSINQYERGWYNGGVLLSPRQIVRRLYKEFTVSSKVQDLQNTVDLLAPDVADIKTKISPLPALSASVSANTSSVNNVLSTYNVYYKFDGTASMVLPSSYTLDSVGDFVQFEANFIGSTSAEGMGLLGATPAGLINKIGFFSPTQIGLRGNASDAYSTWTIPGGTAEFKTYKIEVVAGGWQLSVNGSVISTLTKAHPLVINNIGGSYTSGGAKANLKSLIIHNATQDLSLISFSGTNVVQVLESKNEILSKVYVSYDPVGLAGKELFTIYLKMNDNSNYYVGYQVAHIVDTSIRADLWRIYKADLYKFVSNKMLSQSIILQTLGESEFVFQETGKVDASGGFHGDELLSSVYFYIDGVRLSSSKLSVAFSLMKANEFQYEQSSSIYEADTTGVTYTNPNSINNVRCLHRKITIFSDGGYDTFNSITWKSFPSGISPWYSGISCIAQPQASEYRTENLIYYTASTTTPGPQGNELGARHVYYNNPSNKLSAHVESRITRIKSGSSDKTAEFDAAAIMQIYDDGSNRSKYYRNVTGKIPVVIDEIWESRTKVKHSIQL